MNSFRKRKVFIVLFLLIANYLLAGNSKNGSKLCFANFSLSAEYKVPQITSVVISEESSTFEIIHKEHINSPGILFDQETTGKSDPVAGSICIGTLKNDFIAAAIASKSFKIRSDKSQLT